MKHQIGKCAIYRLIIIGILCMNSVDAKIIIMRHGESLSNVEQFYSSNPNHHNYREAPLTHKGIAQVRDSSSKLLNLGYNKDNTIAYVSPLPRTRQTIDILVDAGVVSREMVYVDSRLIETQMGDREGKPYADFSNDHWDHSGASSYNGETEAQVAHRVEAMLRELASKYQQSNKNIILITHGTPALYLIKICTKNSEILQPSEFKVIYVKNLFACLSIQLKNVVKL